MSREGLPLRLGVRDGKTSDRTETPVALEACVALGLAGVRGLVAERKAYCQRTLGVCLEQRVGLSTVVPCTWAVRQEVEGGASSTARCLACSPNLDGPARSQRDVGTGPGSSAQWKWTTLPDALLWKRSVCSLCTPARWRSKRWAPLLRPKPKRPSASQSTSGAWQPAGVPVPPTQRRPSPTQKAGGRAGGAARRGSGADMTSNVKSGLPIVLHVLRPPGLCPLEEPEPVRHDG